ncbi:MAG: Formimidoyltetrahydrofolate cyclodeaminase [Solirubrobacterales bacterium]|nr:Formimidoyltetrahydrofolate cyclodeaminase [Solirubrobacterales bacterium]
MAPPILLAVPNISEGREEQTIASVARALTEMGSGTTGRSGEGVPRAGVRLLDVHSDRDHHRSVFTLSGTQGPLVDALLAGAAAAIERIDVVSRADQDGPELGQHPHVGAVDVAPVVYLDESARGAACAEALVLAERIGSELQVPVFLYGELTASDRGAATSRAELRRGGVTGLAERMRQHEVHPDFGPSHIHPSAGATLVAARPPLVAFNLQLAPGATVADARRIATVVREGGEEGLPGVRAIAVALDGGIAQVSMNVERPFEVPLAAVVEAVARHAEVASAELVGLAPRAALEGFPASLTLQDFDPARHVIENALGW